MKKVIEIINILMLLSKEKIKRVADFFLDILFPPICLNCRSHLPSQKLLLCPLCFELLEINSFLHCPECGQRIVNLKFSCPHQASFFLAAASNYFPPIPALIHYFKYKKLEGISDFLSALLIVYLKKIDLNLSSFYITYIPLYWIKEKQRGFNQAQILAEKIANYFSLPLLRTLKRIKNTPSQAKSKNFQERQKNIANCFLPINPSEIKGKNFILIDDIYTSGSTIKEAVKVLKENGAKKIIALVVAKA